jgi:hypothetical protein
MKKGHIPFCQKILYVNTKKNQGKGWQSQPFPEGHL